jgi:ADP-ribosylglycohydrolase
VDRAQLTRAVRAGLVAGLAGDVLGAPLRGREPRAIHKRDVGQPGTMVATGATDRLLAAARGLPVGSADTGYEQALMLGFSEGDIRVRRALALALGPWAVPLSTLASWSLEDRQLRHAVDDAADGWVPSMRGVADRPRAVLGAVFALVHREDDPGRAIVGAVRLGGLTSTVALLVGAISAVRRPEEVPRLRWLDAVTLPDDLDGLVDGIVDRRLASTPPQ